MSRRKSNYESGISINRETGEVSDIIIDKHSDSQYFWKVWLSDILTVLGIISNSKQIDAVIYIMDNIRPSDNLFIGSYETIAKGAKTSKNTVIAIMKKLLANDFLRKKQNGVYQINPKYMLKGREDKRRLIINYYNDLEPYNKNDEPTE